MECGTGELPLFLFEDLGVMGNQPPSCAENGGKAPADIPPYLPWEMSEALRNTLARPPPSCLLSRVSEAKPP